LPREPISPRTSPRLPARVWAGRTVRRCSGLSSREAFGFRNDPKLFSYLATYEQKLTKNFHLNFNLLLKLQSLRQPVPAKEKTMTAAA
jgi:hypothetical protein